MYLVANQTVHLLRKLGADAHTGGGSRVGAAEKLEELVKAKLKMSDIDFTVLVSPRVPHFDKVHIPSAGAGAGVGQVQMRSTLMQSRY